MEQFDLPEDGDWLCRRPDPGTEMTIHTGVAIMPAEPRQPTDVLVELLAGYVIIKDSNGERLGTWRAHEVHEVRARPEEETRLLLKAGNQMILFETEDPGGFIRSLEKQQHFQRMPPSDRMRQATRTDAVRSLWSPDGGELEGRPESEEKPEGEEKPGSEQKPGSDRASVPHDRDVWPTLESTWHEPEEVVQEVSVEKMGSGKHANKRALRDSYESVQATVVDSFESGMKAWFGFYFKTGAGSGQERLSTAITGLREASDRLHQLADALSAADHAGQAEANSLQPYRDAVGSWGRGLSMIAEGIELDNQSAARRGLALLVEGGLTAKLVVRGPLYPNFVSYRTGGKRVFRVDEALRYLLAVSPPRGVPKTAERHAKQPWEQAIIAAGSPFRRL